MKDVDAYEDELRRLARRNAVLSTIAFIVLNLIMLVVVTVIDAYVTGTLWRWMFGP